MDSHANQLKSAEYFARYNLGNDVPFEPYTNGIVSFTEISEQSRGAVRPTWELLHTHYVQIKGLDAPWTTAYLNKSLEFFGGYEGGAGSWGEGSGHYDGLGWGSLLHHLDEADVNLPKPSTETSVPTATASVSTAGDSQPLSTTLSTVRTSPSSTLQATVTKDAATSSYLTKATVTASPQLSTTTSIPTIISQPTSGPKKGCIAKRFHV